MIEAELLQRMNALPPAKFVAFGIRTAGWMIDFDTEVLLYTEMCYWPGEPANDNSPAIPPRPEESCL